MVVSDPLFSDTPLIETSGRVSPLVIVGLPRSGSSYLADIVSRIEDWYVFDDLYTERHANLIGARGHMSAPQLDEMLYWLGWQIRARLRNSKYALPKVAEDEIEAMNDGMRAALKDRPTDWMDLQEEWMRRLAARNGARQWGYKMPVAFRSMDMILERHPETKFIFILRNPQEILASYKFMPMGHKDGDPRNYHPAFYAMYWRMAARAYSDAKQRFGDKVLLIKFDDLIADSFGTAEHVAGYLGSVAKPERFTDDEKANSSFSGDRKVINGLEAFILRSLAGKEAAEIGFELDRPKLRLRDFAELLYISGRFTLHRIIRFVKVRKEIFGRLKRGAAK